MTTPTQDRASTSAHAQVLVTIDGVSLGEFDTRTGGETIAEVSKHTPGSSPSARVALGGPRDTADVTISRAFVAKRDLPLIKAYEGKVGTASVTVTQTPRDKDRRVLTGANDTKTWTGILSGMTHPEYDANSADVAMWELTMVCDGAA